MGWRDILGFWQRYDSDSALGGSTQGLLPLVGAIEFNFLPETKSDPCRVVIAYETLLGFSLGNWVQ